MRKFYLGILGGVIITPALVFAGFFDWFNWLVDDEPDLDHFIVNEYEDLDIVEKKELKNEEFDDFVKKESHNELANDIIKVNNRENIEGLIEEREDLEDEGLDVVKIIFQAPEKGAVDIRGKAPVTFIWNQPVFSLENPDSVVKKLRKFVKISPKMEGDFQLVGTTGFLFEPKNEWGKSTKYEFKFSDEFFDELMIEHENKIEISRDFDNNYWFETPRLKLKSVIANDLYKRRPLILEFSQKIDLGELKDLKLYPELDFDLEYVKEKKIKDGGVVIAKKGFSFGNISSKVKNKVKLIPRDNWKESQRYKIVLPVGIKSLEGDLKTLKEQSYQFSTIRPFRVGHIGKPYDVFGNLSISFSKAVNLDDFFENVQLLEDGDNILTGEYLAKIKKNYFKKDGTLKNKNISYFNFPAKDNYWNPKAVYEIILDENIEDIYGRNLKENYEQKFSAKFPNKFKEVFLLPDNVLISRESVFKPKFWYSGNVKTVKVSLERFLIPDFPQKFEKTYELPEAENKEAFFEIDFSRDFPDILDENGNFLAGGYELKIEVERNKKDYWGDYIARKFFVGDFAIGVNKIAKFVNKQDRDNSNGYANYTVFFNDFETGEQFENEAKVFIYKQVYINNRYTWKRAVRAVSAVESGENVLLENNGNWLMLAKIGDKIGIGGQHFKTGFDLKNINRNARFYYPQTKTRDFGFTDRLMYKPGDVVYFKDIFREVAPLGQDFFLKKLKNSRSFNVRITDPRWNEIANFSVKNIDENWGSLDGQWKIPEDVKLGDYRLEISGNNVNQTLKFYIGNYRKANFLVNSQFKNKQVVGDEEIVARISAEYAFGGALAHKKVEYKLVLKGQKINDWRILNFYDWGIRDCFDCVNPKESFDEIILKSGDGVLDENGEFEVLVTKDLLKNKKIEALKSRENLVDVNWNQVVLTATIRDGKTEEVSTSSKINYFENFYKFELGRTDYFYEAGQLANFAGKIVDLENNSIADLTLIGELQKKIWNDETEQMELSVIKNIKLQTDKNGQFEWDVELPKNGGNYQILFKAQDPRTKNLLEAKVNFWIAGLDNKSVQQNKKKRNLLLIPDKKKYQVGDVAKIFVVNPDLKVKFSRVLLERGEELEQLKFDVKNSLIEVEIKDWMVPNVFVSTVLFGENLAGIGDVRYGLFNLEVENPARKLVVKISPNKKSYKSGDIVKIDLESLALGRGIPAEVSVMVVDKTLLSLKGLGDLDIFSRFFETLPFGNEFSHGLANFMSITEIKNLQAKAAKILLLNADEDFAKPEMLMADELMDGGVFGANNAIKGRGIMQKSMAMPMLGSVAMDSMEQTASQQGVATVRSEFADLAVFKAAVKTDQNGKGYLEFKLPDNLTTWKIVAVAHAKDQRFGNGEAEIKTTLPLLVSEIVPQFFRMGDVLRIGVLVKIDENSITSSYLDLHDKKAIFSVSLLDVEGLEMIGQSRKKIELSADKTEMRVYFDVKVPVDFDEGEKFAKFQFKVEQLFGNWGAQYFFKTKDLDRLNIEKLADAVEISRNIYPPKVKLTVADFFRVENLKKINLKIDYQRSLKSQIFVKTFLSLVDRIGAFVDVTKQTNYGCAEQQFSYGTSLLVQRQFNEILGRKNPKIKEELFENVQKFISEAFVNGGGFSFWKYQNKPNVWVTSQILEFADLWAKAGFPFDENQLMQSENYLKREIFKNCNVLTNWRCLSDATRQNAAYILAIRDKLSVSEFKKLRVYLNSLEARIWWLKSLQILGGVNKFGDDNIADKIAKIWVEIDSLMKVRDRYVFWEEFKNYRSFYSQNERLTALLLGLLVDEGRLRSVQPKVVRYLTDMENRYLSGNTALRVIQVLGKYAQLNEVENIGSEAVVTLNDKEVLVAEKLVNLDEVISNDYKFELNEKVENQVENGDYEELLNANFVEFKTENKKPFYGEIELKEIFKAKDLSAISRGFWLDRKIYKLSDIKFENPVQKLVQGENYVVRLKVVTNTAHRQVMLEDAGIGGAEFVNFDFDNANQNLAKYVSKKANDFGGFRCYGWCRPNFVHQEFHDEKARFFADYLPAGTFEITYVIKARLTGEFDWIPAKIEEMYYPEVFGLTNGEMIVIE